MTTNKVIVSKTENNSKNNSKKTLFLIGGITQHNYILKEYQDVIDFKNLQYDEIVEIDYEEFLDKRYEKIPFYSYFKTLDKHGDWWQFSLNKNLRNKIREYIENEIIPYTIFDNQVDVYSHSLGTWIILGCRLKLNKLVLVASPLGSKSRIVRFTVNNELKNNINIEANKIEYMYNNEDFVSSKFPKDFVKEKLRTISKDNIFYANISKGHNFKKYIEAYKFYNFDLSSFDNNFKC